MEKDQHFGFLKQLDDAAEKIAESTFSNKKKSPWHTRLMAFFFTF